MNEGDSCSIASSVPVSVVIPCFRCSATIKRAVDSIVRQTSRPAQVILVDDASADGTWDVLLELKWEYRGWIDVYQQPTNMGAASARNVGWSIATQPYIAFLDADDAWHPRKLEIQYGYMKEHPDITLTGHLYKVLTDNLQMPEWHTQSPKAQPITWFKLLLRNYFVTPSVMMKNLTQPRFMEGKRYVDDHLLWLQVIASGEKTALLEVDLAAVYKPMYGASGLSSHLWAMEKAELFNYRYLHSQGALSFAGLLFMQIFSFAKYLRRLLIIHFVRRNA